MAESYEVTVKVRVSTPGQDFGDDDTRRGEWVRDGAGILKGWVDDEVGTIYRKLGAGFEIVSSTAIPTTLVGISD